MFVLFAPVAVAQSHGGIAGTVLDGESGLPLLGVHVFYEGTTIGVVSDPSGKFELPARTTKGSVVVFSMIGYVRQQLVVADLLRQIPLEVHLQPETVELGGVVVTGELDRTWRRNLARFEEILFNDTDFSSNCSLQNPEVLDFEFDKSQDLLSAVASEPLIVSNSALGYMIELHDFTLEGSPDYFQWKGATFFSESESSNATELREWEANRKTAYRGSSRHFFSALANKRLIDEQFRAYQSPLPRSANLGVPIPEMGPEYRGRWEDGDSLYTPILSTSDDSSSFLVHAPFSLTVQYLGEHESNRYDKSYGSRGSGLQTSWMHFGGSTITIDTHGNQISAKGKNGVGLVGYMSWERVCELLPSDFVADSTAKR